MFFSTTVPHLYTSAFYLLTPYTTIPKIPENTDHRDEVQTKVKLQTVTPYANSEMPLSHNTQY